MGRLNRYILRSIAAPFLFALTALTSQFQGRQFNENAFTSGSVLTYGHLYNPQNLRGFRNWSNVLTLNWTQNLSRSSERALALETFFSYQKDHTIVAPLTQEGWRASLDPFGGFMIGAQVKPDGVTEN